MAKRPPRPPPPPVSNTNAVECGNNPADVLHNYRSARPSLSVPQLVAFARPVSMILESVEMDDGSGTRIIAAQKLAEKRELVAEWQVPIRGRIHRIQFEHGTTSGKRVIRVDDTEILRRDWMFKLVGEDIFELEDKRCIIRVEPLPGFKYNYELYVDGKPLEQYTDWLTRALKAWDCRIGDTHYRIALEKDTLNIWLNGKIREEMGEFVDNGTDTTFHEDGAAFLLQTRSSGSKREGIIHKLLVNGVLIEESVL